MNGVRSLEKCAHYPTHWSEVAGGLQNLLGFVVPRLAPRFVQGAKSGGQDFAAVREKGGGDRNFTRGGVGVADHAGCQGRSLQKGPGFAEVCGRGLGFAEMG